MMPDEPVIAGEQIGTAEGLNPNIDYRKPTAAQQNSLDMRKEINARVGCRILVSTQEERDGLVDVLNYWRQEQVITHMPEVYASTRVAAGKVVIEG